MGDDEVSEGLLYAFAVMYLKGHSNWELEDDAIAALGGGSLPNAWKDYRAVVADEGQWFYWREPAHPDDVHVDRVAVDAHGRIECKYGCGLDSYTDCQPCRFTDEVKQILAARGAPE